MMKLLAMLFGLCAAFCACQSTPAATENWVNWLDTAAYEKPKPVFVAEPNESTANKYYVNMSGGSGTTCSQASPCSSLSAVVTHGITLPAYIYVKGTGAFGDPTLAGASGSEIVIKPWDDATLATFTGRNNWNGPAKSFLIIDGGPNLQIKFLNDTGNEFDPSIYFNSTAANHHDITFYRTHWHVSIDGEYISAYGGFSNLNLINNEFESQGATVTGNQHHIYLTGCNGGQTLTGLNVRSNIFRDEPGEAFELKYTGSTVDNYFWDGNVFHNLGKGTCNSGWNCRAAITFSGDTSGCPSNGHFGTNFVFQNNLVFDIGRGCLQLDAAPSTLKVYHNTCYNWGQCSGSTNGIWPSAAFPTANFSSGTVPGDYENNIIYATGSIPNCGGGATPRVVFSTSSVTKANNNACASGQSCGSSSQIVSDASFLSVNSSSAGFLQLVSGSTPVDHGVTTLGVTTDFDGKARNIGAAPDLGAFEFGTGNAATRPLSPIGH